MKNLIVEHHNIIERKEYMKSIKIRRDVKININDLICQKRRMCKHSENGWDIRGLMMLQPENINRWMPTWTPNEIAFLKANYKKPVQNIHTIINERFAISNS